MQGHPVEVPLPLGPLPKGEGVAGRADILVVTELVHGGKREVRGRQLGGQRVCPKYSKGENKGSTRVSNGTFLNKGFVSKHQGTLL